MNAKYGAICGYKQEELESSFKEYIESVSQEMEMTIEEVLSLIKKWYNGYWWDEKTSISI